MADNILDLQARIDAQRAPDPAEEPSFGISDDELALRFTEKHKAGLRYVAAWDRWYVWTGTHWQRDDRRQVFDLARIVCREALAEAIATEEPKPGAEKALRQRLGSASTVWSLVKLAGTDPTHAVTPDQLDSDPWKLNTPGGLIDLRTGTIGPHDPSALCTKITLAAPGGECPTWNATLARVLPDPEVRAYMQRLAGYALTGSSREHVSPFAFGHGRNGKTTVIGTIRTVMGDYALDVQAELLTESHNERHPCELAVLHGARLVVGSEIDQGKRWNESRLKRLTGGDRISARFIGRDPFSFEPTHTLVILANTKPAFRCVDEAVRRRVHLIPFDVQISENECDPKLPEKLAAEASGILAWAISGCIAWQERGLDPPKAIRDASSTYLDQEDSIAAWLSERCELSGQLKLTAAHRDYRDWCESAGAPPLGRTGFGDQLAAHGVRRETDRKGTVMFHGLTLKSSTATGYGDEY